MQPATMPLQIVQGATLRHSLRVMQSQFVYRPIDAIASTAPVLLAVQHELPMDWPVWVQGVQGLQELNRGSNQAPLLATVVDAETLEVNSVRADGRMPSGGMLVYHPPVDLTGATAVAQVLDERGNLLLDISPVVHAGGWIELNLSAEQTAALEWRKGTWLLNVVLHGGEVIAAFAGAAYVVAPGMPALACGSVAPWVYTFGTQGPPGVGGEGGGGGGLVSFNGRSTPAVVLVGSDVTAALGYVPVNTTALADVAFSSSYDDLIDKPFIPGSYGDIGAASAAQGALADTAVQPAALAVQINTRVEKISGYGLSQENFTSELRIKLEGFVQYDKGNYLTIEALRLAIPVGQPGWKATIDPGTGVRPRQALWDYGDNDWVLGTEAVEMNAAQVKTLYESNADTWAFDTAAKTKLGTIAAGATKNLDTDSLPEAASNPINLWFTAVRARAVTALGLSLSDGSDAVPGDSFLVILGKLQRQATDLRTSITNLASSITTALGNKVDKVSGKGLSTEDYTSAEKTKLSLIAAEATKNQTDAYLLARANQTGQVPGNAVNGITQGMRNVAKSVMNERRAVMPFTDQITTAPTAAYNLVRVVPTYTSGPCIQIQRSADNATNDIGFAADGIVDTDAILNFQNGTAAPSAYIYLRTFYDQSGNGHHMVNTGAVSTMPQIDCTYLRNGMPTIFTTTGRSLPIPSTLTVAATNNFAVFTAIGNYSPKATASPWALGTGTQCDLLLTPGTSNSVQIRTNGVVNQYTEGAATLANSNGCVVGLNVIPTEMRWFRNNVTYTRATTTAPNTLATTGGTFMPAGRLDVYGMLIYNTGLTRADATTIQSAMTNANRCVYKPTAQVVLCGDSIGEGAFDFAHNYNKELWNYFGLNVAIYNVSLSGQTYASQAGEVSTKVANLYKTGMQNIALNHAGVNDITGGATGAATYASAVTWHAAVKGAGFTTIQMLLYNRAVTGAYTAAMETEKNAFNDLVRANTGAGKALGIDLVDVSLEPQNMPYIKTAFFPDNLHPNQAGNVLNAPQMANTLYTQMYAAA